MTDDALVRALSRALLRALLRIGHFNGLTNFHLRPARPHRLECVNNIRHVLGRTVIRVANAIARTRHLGSGVSPTLLHRELSLDIETSSPSTRVQCQGWRVHAHERDFQTDQLRVRDMLHTR